jgi:hypothetical protein
MSSSSAGPAPAPAPSSSDSSHAPADEQRLIDQVIQLCDRIEEMTCRKAEIKHDFHRLDAAVKLDKMELVAKRHELDIVQARNLELVGDEAKRRKVTSKEGWWF